MIVCAAVGDDDAASVVLVGAVAGDHGAADRVAQRVVDGALHADAVGAGPVSFVFEDPDADALTDLEAGAQAVGRVVVLDEEVVGAPGLDAARVEAQVAVQDLRVGRVVEHHAAVRLLVRRDADHLVAVGVVDDHAGVAVAVVGAALDGVAVRPGLHQHAGVAGVVDRVVEEDVLGRALEQHAAVAVEVRVGRDAVHRVALDQVPVGSQDVDLLAEVAVDLVVPDGAVLGAGVEEHPELVVRDLAVADRVAVSAVVGVEELDAGDGIAKAVHVVQDGVRGARRQERAPAELADDAVLHEHVGAAADPDAGREAFLLAGRVRDQVVGTVDDLLVQVDDDVRSADDDALTRAVVERGLGRHDRVLRRARRRSARWWAPCPGPSWARAAPGPDRP